MLLIPYKKLTFHSALSDNVLTSRLQENTENYSGFRFDNYSKSSKLFVGKVGERTFDIRPVYEGRNSFIPYVQGIIESSATGSKVTLTMRLHYAVAVGLTAMVAFMIYSVIKYRELHGLLFIFFIYLMTVGFFNVDYAKTKKALQDIFEAQVTRPSVDKPEVSSEN